MRVIVATRKSMLGRVQVYRAVWPLLASLLVVCACNNALACGLCPQETPKTSHCSEKAADSNSHHSINHEPANAVTEQTENCSHCVTHSPRQTNSSSRAIVPNNASQDTAVGHWTVAEGNLQSSTKLIEIHDHGPPGFHIPRYVLNNTFRI